MRNTFAAPDRGLGIRVMLALLVCVVRVDWLWSLSDPRCLQERGDARQVLGLSGGPF